MRFCVCIVTAFVGWVERSETHQGLLQSGGVRFALPAPYNSSHYNDDSSFKNSSCSPQ
jgi:hypothetical protein